MRQDTVTSSLPAALALVLNTLVWGCSWWPLRELELRGVHPLWTTVVVFSAASAFCLARTPRALPELFSRRALWLLALAAGATNAAFSWALVVGDVVRVVLLFYLMPIWAVLLARWLLHERLTAAAIARLALSLLGAAFILWPAGDGAHWLTSHALADGLGLLGGMAFALNNVLLRREAQAPEPARALASFAGGLIVPAALALALTAQGVVPAPPPPHSGWLMLAGGFCLAVMVGNWALLYGAARLPADVTAVVMLTEVLFAATSAVAWGAGTLTLSLGLGGAFIVLAALLAAIGPA